MLFGIPTVPPSKYQSHKGGTSNGPIFEPCRSDLGSTKLAEEPGFATLILLRSYISSPQGDGFGFPVAVDSVQVWEALDFFWKYNHSSPVYRL